MAPPVTNHTSVNQYFGMASQENALVTLFARGSLITLKDANLLITRGSRAAFLAWLPQRGAASPTLDRDQWLVRDEMFASGSSLQSGFCSDVALVLLWCGASIEYFRAACLQLVTRDAGLDPNHRCWELTLLPHKTRPVFKRSLGCH